MTNGKTPLCSGALLQREEQAHQRTEARCVGLIDSQDLTHSCAPFPGKASHGARADAACGNQSSPLSMRHDLRKSTRKKQHNPPMMIIILSIFQDHLIQMMYNSTWPSLSYTFFLSVGLSPILLGGMQDEIRQRELEFEEDRSVFRWSPKVLKVFHHRSNILCKEGILQPRGTKNYIFWALKANWDHDLAVTFAKTIKISSQVWPVAMSIDTFQSTGEEGADGHDWWKGLWLWASSNQGPKPA